VNRGAVVSLQLFRRHEGPSEPVSEVRASPLGLEGDVHSGREWGKRQVLLTDSNDLRELGLRPGDLREQVTVDLAGLMHRPPGTRLRLGEVELELTGPCEPCMHIGEHVGLDDVEAFRQTLRGRRGMLARVEAPGVIRVGDSVELLDAEPVEAEA
jgi:MOSC domain-containing protein YiiM